MARKANDGSNRQLAFKYLDKHNGRPRAELLDELMVELDIGLVYAKTLYQNWRTLSKQSGSLTEVFTIRDHKDGVTVDPYVFTKHVSNPSRKSAKTEAKAVLQYIDELHVRMTKATNL